MTKVAITEQYLTDIADAIRAKSGTSGRMTPADMASAISDIPIGGSDSVYVFTVAPYSNVDVLVNNTVIDPRLAYQVSAWDTITFRTYSSYILQTVTGMTSGDTIPFNTISRGTYTFTMPAESVECSLLYDD